MDDAGARHAGERRRMREQPIHQRAIRLAGARMHDQADRLVDDDQRVVLEDDLERHLLREREAAAAGAAAPARRARRGNRMPRRQALAVDLDVALLEPCLQAVARILVEKRASA